MASNVNMNTTTFPPYVNNNPIPKAIKNPPNAVMNHPLTTVITPEIRYTALSRPQARSASDDPIATINPTYVVDKGSLNAVASAISPAALVRLTVARIISKGAPVCSTSATSKRRANIRLTCLGIHVSTYRTTPKVPLTTARAKADEPYSCCVCSLY